MHCKLNFLFFLTYLFFIKAPTSYIKMEYTFFASRFYKL